MRINSGRILELQQEHSVSNYRLAKELGVHQTTVKNWQQGCTPQLEHLAALCHYFGVPMEELLHNDADTGK